MIEGEAVCAQRAGLGLVAKEGPSALQWIYWGPLLLCLEPPDLRCTCTELGSHQLPGVLFRPALPSPGSREVNPESVCACVCVHAFTLQTNPRGDVQPAQGGAGGSVPDTF